ncbi:MAG TPA: trigger factor [Chitinispirillaceae bacterium]|nr:trigger factor [Chitinispirillaceae bacterium]
MKATVSEPETWKRVIDIEVPQEEIEGAFNQKLKKYKNEIKMPGFRPGKVPESLIKQRFGASIRAEVVEEFVQKSFREACETNQIFPVSQPKVNSIKDEENAPLVFQIEAQVDPKIEIKGYDKLKVKATPKKIKDSDVDQAIEELRERFAEFKDVDRPAKKGDYIRLEYQKIIIDGQERTDLKNPDYPVELGGEGRIKDFDKGLFGHSAGESVDLNIKFPKDYPDVDAAGKNAEFTIKINSVQEKSLPEINDEFLKKVGQIESDEALREQIFKNLEQEEQNKAKGDAYNKAIDILIKENPFEVPPVRIEQFLDYMQQETQKYQRPGMPAMTRQEIEEQYHETAIRSIKRQRIIDYVASKEKIKPTKEEVDNEIQKVAEMYNQQFENIKQVFRQNGTTLRIRDDIKERKTLDYLIGEWEPPAKSE